MPELRDWTPPYPHGDERNRVHRRAYDQASAAHPEWRWRQCTDYADDVLAGWVLTQLPCPAEVERVPLTIKDVDRFESEFHRFWTECVGREFYDKESWRNTLNQVLLLRKGIK